MFLKAGLFIANKPLVPNLFKSRKCTLFLWDIAIPHFSEVPKELCAFSKSEQVILGTVGLFAVFVLPESCQSLLMKPCMKAHGLWKNSGALRWQNE